MDFKYRYTTEQEEFRQEVRAWLGTNIPENMKAPVDRLDLTEEHYRFWREMHQTLAAKGWLYPTYPKEYGGGGLSGEHETIILEEFGTAHGRTVAARRRLVALYEALGQPARADVYRPEPRSPF